MTSIKLILSYHKPDVLLKDSVLTPVHAGRALARKRLPADSPDLQWLLENTTGDDTGDNISEKNPSYNEMTAVYWAWKNYADLGDPDYIGFMHYRRHFLFKDGPFVQTEVSNLGEPEYLEETLGYSPEAVAEILSGCDFVYPRPHKRASMWEHFRANHHIQDLEVAVEILKEKFPRFAGSAQKYLDGGDAIFCNMFIMPKAMFFEYAQFVFAILEELEVRADLDGKRLFVSESLTGIFITEMLARGKVGRSLPMVIAEGQHTVDVVVAASPSYVLPLSVTLTSLLENAQPNTDYDVYILVSEEYPAELHQAIMSFEERYPGTRINFVPVQGFDHVTVTTSHVQVHTYFRLLIPSKLSHLKRCVYLDTDVVVEQDLTQLYRMGIDDKYLAGVYAAGYRTERHDPEKIGLPSYDRYVNAGVLLMNLEKMRKDNLEPRFMELAGKNLPSDDQDVLNIACYDGIRILPFHFNVMTKYFPRNADEFFAYTGVKESWTRAEYRRAMEAPVVIHYADKRKPWLDSSVDFAERWWHYAMRSPLRQAIAEEYLEGSIATGAERVLRYRSDAVEGRRLKAERSPAEIRKYQNAVIAAARLERELEATRNSTTFRVGRLVTVVPRRLRRALARGKAAPAPATKPVSGTKPAGGTKPAVTSSAPVPKPSAVPAKPAVRRPTPPPAPPGGLRGMVARLLPSSRRHANILAANQAYQIKLRYAELAEAQHDLGRALEQKQDELARAVTETQDGLSEAVARLQRSVSDILSTVEASHGEVTTAAEQALKTTDALGTIRRVADDTYARVNDTLRSASEGVWSSVFHDTVASSEWYTDRALSPGRWAVGYPFLYVLYRVLDEMHPVSILELGLGQSTKMIAQYVAQAENATHTVVEHDEKWIEFFGANYALPPSSTVQVLGLTDEPYKDDPAVLRYAGFKEALASSTYDLICIDGPFGGQANVFARLDVLDLLPECLRSSFVIMLDDYNRPGEQRAAQEITAALERADIPVSAARYAGAKAVWLGTSTDLEFFGSL